MGRATRATLAAALVGATTIAAPSAQAADIARYSARPAPAWTALFDRTSGWTGADGVYSIPLSGDERAGPAKSGRTLFFFSDSFVGTVRPNGSRVNTTLVNNTTATLSGRRPVAADMTFRIRESAGGQAVAMVQPDPRLFAGQWFWPSDGIATGGKVYVYAMRVKSADTPPFSFASAGSSLLSADASEPAPFFGDYAQRATPLFVPADSASGRRESYFGLAVMPMTVASGAPNPDGYLYVYGTRSGEYQKSLLVARVTPEQIEDFSAYRFWNGRDWIEKPAAAAPLTYGVSAEFSVQPLADGRFLLVHMKDLLGSTVAVRYGESPVGPWGADIPIWDCPEAALTPNTYVYGAKAHPHLSKPGELLISYHVNTFDFAENFAPGGVDIYRPRFVTVPLP